MKYSENDIIMIYPKTSNNDSGLQLDESYRRIQNLNCEIQDLNVNESEEKYRLIDKRNKEFNIFQRKRLLINDESEEALRWMIENGGEGEDLVALEIFKVCVGDKLSSRIQSLLIEAESSIRKRLIEKQEHVIKKEDLYEKEAIPQRTRLLLAASMDEVKQALLWFEEKAKKEEDLISVKNFKKFKQDADFLSSEIESLMSSADRRITQRIISQNGKISYFQIIGSIDEYISRFGHQLYLVETHGFLSIIMAPAEVVDCLREYFPVGRIDYAKTKVTQATSPNLDLNQEPNKKGEASMFKVVQLNTPVTNRLKKQICDTNAEIITPLGRGEFVLLVANKEVASKIEQLPAVSHLTPYTPKIDERLKYLDREEASLPARIGANPQLERNRAPIAESGDAHFPGIWILIFFRQEDRDRAAENLRDHQIEIVGEEGDDALVIDLIHYPHNWQQALEAIKSQSGLREIEEDSPASFFNNRAVPLIAEGVVPAHNPDPIGSNSLNLTGSGETIGIADSGLDTGDINNLHPDFQKRVIAIEDLGRSGTMYKYHQDEIDFCPVGADRHSGHGTHVAGSAIGSSGNSPQTTNQILPIRGMASEAKLFFQSRGYIKPQEQPIEEYFDTLNIAGILQGAYENRARIHSNSWGLSRRSCEYHRSSKSIDKFMWDNKDFLVVVAAGNEGIHTDPNTTWIDSSSICPPGTAKNCLTVGASENNRYEQFRIAYGRKYRRRFPYPPFFDNGLADSSDDIAAFSSRGPCGGRYKPDVIAPGTFVLSTRSSQLPEYEYGSADYEPDRSRYMYMCGTSMATPLVAGGAALVRQYLREERQIENPTAALVKATIIHSAQYIDRDSYPHLHPDSRPWVDNEQGWGRVSLANSLRQNDDPSKVIFEQPFLEGEGLLLGEWYEYQIKIVSGESLRIILTYTDAPGDELINNLNLIVYSPNNKYYVGNYFDRDGEDGVDDKWLDNTNNVEGVVVESPESGTWRIMVLAADVSEGKQDFALVASGEELEIIDRNFYPNHEERDALE
jgi:serine protease AprX